MKKQVQYYNSFNMISVDRDLNKSVRLIAEISNLLPEALFEICEAHAGWYLKNGSEVLYRPHSQEIILVDYENSQGVNEAPMIFQLALRGLASENNLEFDHHLVFNENKK